MKRLALIVISLVFCLMCSVGVYAVDGTETESNDTLETADEIEMGKEYSGTVSNNDADWFKFTVPDQSVKPGYFRIIFNVKEAPLQFGCELKNSDNNSIYSFDQINAGQNTSPVFGFRGQDMYLVVNDIYSSSTTYEYSVKIEYTEDACFEAEDNDNLNRADKLLVGENNKKQGNLYKEGDTDYYKVDIPSAGYYSACVYHRNGDDYARDYGYKATLVDKNSSTVTSIETEKSGETASESVRLEQDTYYVKIEGKGFIFDTELKPYFVYVKEAPAPQPNENTQESQSWTLLDETGSVERTGQANGNWHEFIVPDQAQTPGYFNVKFQSINGDVNFWRYELTDKDKHTVYEARSNNGTIDMSPSFGFSGQTMYLNVYAASGYIVNSNNNSYRISVEYTRDGHYEAEYNDDIGTANDLAVGEKKQGTIHKNKSGSADVDYYKVNVSEAGEHTVSFYHNTGDRSAGWKVTLLDKDNSEVKKFIAKKSGESTETADLNSGIYYIKVEKNYSLDDIKDKLYSISLQPGIGGISFSDQTTVDIGEYPVTYYKVITFFGKGKKFKNENEIKKVFGEITVSWNGVSYKVTSLKVSKKSGNNYIQILKTENSDKNFNKGLKKLTKGSSGIPFTMVPLKITEANYKTLVEAKEKGGKVKSVKINTNGPKPVYKAKKNKDYTVNGKTITFKGENLEGSCTV